MTNDENGSLARALTVGASLSRFFVIRHSSFVIPHSSFPEWSGSFCPLKCSRGSAELSAVWRQFIALTIALTLNGTFSSFGCYSNATS
jgi:hypothetical protein